MVAVIGFFFLFVLLCCADSRRNEDIAARRGWLRGDWRTLHPARYRGGNVRRGVRPAPRNEWS